MARRVTFVIDYSTYKKLRDLQAKMIKNSKNNISFSKMINDLLRKSL
ncbi:hypothetical protein [Nitrosopumilus sp.]|nr:hypothetical protein [Nitrosopumilus sp.]